MYDKKCENKTLARAYVPMQQIKELYSGDEGLLKGTIFPELYQPYMCKKDVYMREEKRDEER